MRVLLMLVVTLDDSEIMLIGTDQWDAQPVMIRVNEWLIATGYVTWFDLTNMQGEKVFDIPTLACASAVLRLPSP